MKYLEINYLKHEFEYAFYNSDNLPQYLFISVIVALFIGLTTSSEEIIGNLKILQREKFLNLSKGSYLFSKIGIMFLISAIQTLLYVIVGNFIFGNKGHVYGSLDDIIFYLLFCKFAWIEHIIKFQFCKSDLYSNSNLYNSSTTF